MKSETRPLGRITERQREQMFGLMQASYYGMDRSAFDRDLGEKEAVFLIIDDEGERVVGFSTVAVLDLEVSGRPVKAVFSGDTIVEEAHRRSKGLGLQLGSFFRACMARFPSVPIVWILTSKGCRTYGLLPALFKDFHPRHDAPTPAFHAEVMRSFGSAKYPGLYDPSTNLIRYGGNPQRLRPGVADADGRRLSDPHARFFVSANPDHMAGNDLVCVADVTEDNFSPLFLRILGSA